MFIIKHKSIFLSISALLVAGAITSLLVFGFHLGIDFKGGTLLEVSYTEERPSVTTVRAVLAEADLAEAVVQPVAEKDLSVKSRPLSETERTALLADLSIDGAYPLTQTAFTSIGPSVGRELSQKAVAAVILVFIGIILFVTMAFRSVTKPVASWKYGLIVIMALLHDVIIAAGVFAAYSHFTGAEVDILIVVAMLTILGTSVSDTIVIFDRVRENLKMHTSKIFSEMVGKSLTQSFTRSFNTSLTVILVLIALFLFGPETTKNFALVLIVGMFFGAYSSLFMASPLLVLFEKWNKGK